MANKLAKTRDGKCIAKIDKNGYKNLFEWECKYGHQFYIDTSDFKRHWCPNPICKLKRRLKGTINDLIKIAEKNGGKCLADDYLGEKIIVKWQCSNGHVFEKTPRDVLHSHLWCPYCKKYTSEERCRFILEKCLQQKFVSTRLVLKCKLELDGYCKELNLAFEHQGKQHYEPYAYFDEEKVKQIKKNDRKKKKECKKRGIILIIIPYTVSKTNSRLAKYVKKQLIKNKIAIKIDPINIDFGDFSCNPRHLYEIKKIATDRGGECLSSCYVNANYPMKFRCKCGYVWEAPSDRVKRGSWCRACSGRMKLDIDKIKHSIESYNIKCLSTIYINSKTKMKWKCLICNNIWMSPYDEIRSNKMCPECGKKKRWETRRQKIKEGIIHQHKCSICGKNCTKGYKYTKDNTICHRCNARKTKKCIVCGTSKKIRLNGMCGNCTKENHIKSANKLCEENGGILPSMEWINENLTALSKYMYLHRSDFAHLPKISDKWKRKLLMRVPKLLKKQNIKKVNICNIIVHSIAKNSQSSFPILTKLLLCAIFLDG